jgi:hypothetical protein
MELWQILTLIGVSAAALVLWLIYQKHSDRWETWAEFAEKRNLAFLPPHQDCPPRILGAYGDTPVEIAVQVYGKKNKVKMGTRFSCYFTQSLPSGLHIVPLGFKDEHAAVFPGKRVLSGDDAIDDRLSIKGIDVEAMNALLSVARARNAIDSFLSSRKRAAVTLHRATVINTGVVQSKKKLEKELDAVVAVVKDIERTLDLLAQKSDQTGSRAIRTDAAALENETAEQDKAEQDEAEQDKAEQDKAEQDKAERAKAERDEAAQGEAKKREKGKKKLKPAIKPQSEKGAQAEEKAKREAEEKAKREAEEKAKREAEEKAKREAEEKAKREAEEKAKREAEEKAKREAEEKAKREAEEKAKREAEEKAKREAEEKAKREAEEKAKREAEEKAKREAEEKAKREAEEKAKREAEEKAKREAEEKAKREAEEKAKREAEEKKKVVAAAKTATGKLEERGSLSDKLAQKLDRVVKEGAKRSPSRDQWSVPDGLAARDPGESGTDLEVEMEIVAEEPPAADAPAFDRGKDGGSGQKPASATKVTLAAKKNGQPVLLKELKQAADDKIGPIDRQEMVRKLRKGVYFGSIKVEEVTWTTGVGLKPSIMLGRTVLGVIGGELDVAVRFPNTENIRLRMIKPGKNLQFKAKVVEWDDLEQRLVLEAQ